MLNATPGSCGSDDPSRQSTREEYIAHLLLATMASQRSSMEKEKYQIDEKPQGSAHVEGANHVVEIDTFRVLGLNQDDTDFYTSFPEDKRKKVFHKVCEPHFLSKSKCLLKMLDRYTTNSHACGALFDLSYRPCEHRQREDRRDGKRFGHDEHPVQHRPIDFLCAIRAVRNPIKHDLEEVQTSILVHRHSLSALGNYRLVIMPFSPEQFAN